MSDYVKFLERKSFSVAPSGISEVLDLNPSMFPHQRDVCSWALRLGRSAAFLGTGMGKTFLELEWARIVGEYTKAPVLLLAPLGVAQQTVFEQAPRFGFSARMVQRQDQVGAGINVTNYDRLGAFDASAFAGVVLDESSILKAFDGKTRTALTESFVRTPFKLCGTATPAPNDYMELGNHAEFLGAMTAAEMLAMFFVHDGGETQKWRLKGHARREFWKWVCSWAVMMRKPSDIGHSDEGFILPPIKKSTHIVDVNTPAEGMLFAKQAETLQERIAARRLSVSDRVNKCAEVVATVPDEQWVIWCNLNGEQDALAAAFGDECVSIYGSLAPDEKLSRLAQWLNGERRILVSKPSIFGFGLNFQQCRNMAFVGLNDSWEQFYQSVRRCWRFGQKREVRVHLIAASTEGNVLENLNRKDREAEEMAEEMAACTQDLTRMNLRGSSRAVAPYLRDVEKGDKWAVHLADCVELAEEMESNSVHYSIYSPPFESLYTYSNSERDMGNSRSSDEFWEHYRFLIEQAYRVMMPGRLVSIHCMNLPISKVRSGYIGIRDFRGEVIRSFEDAGFIYHSEVCIWKDPVTAMQRTKALGLLHKQLKKDAAMSRQGIADYLVTMRKPGDNAEPVTNTNETFPVSVWQRYADPVWDDINPSDTLTFREAREHDDERHICPLQLDVIRRGIRLWSNEGDLVWSPFTGIGSEGYIALEMGRRFIGSELKHSYYRQAVRNLQAVRSKQSLFDGVSA